MNKHLELLEYIESQIGIPFEYGKHDCPLFIAGAIDVMHSDKLDTKLREKYTGLWNNQKTAWKYARRHGSMSEVCKKLGYKPIEIAYIQTGDILIMEQKLAHAKKWHSIAVYTGSKVATMTNNTGVELVSINEVPNICEVLRWL